MSVELVGQSTKEQFQVTGQPLEAPRAANRPTNIDNNGRVPGLLHQLYGALDELQALFPRPFTP
jgi:hypothetical protein